MLLITFDLTLSVGKLSRHSHPTGVYWYALKRVLRYIKDTSEIKIHNIKFTPILKRYNYTNWILDAEDTKSINGYVFILKGVCRCILKMNKTKIITISTMEVELVSLDINGKQVEWLRNLLSEI